MEKYYFVVNLVVYSIIPTLIALYITERVKGSVKNSFDKKLEDVKKEHSLEISKFQTDLNSLKAKENFKFTKLHEKRLEVLEKTYHYIYENLELLKSYVRPFKLVPDDMTFEESERILSDQFTEKHLEFNKYFNYNLIYFDDSIENLLRTYFDQIAEIYVMYDTEQSILPGNVKAEKGPNLDANLPHKVIHEKLIPIKRQIEIKFRDLLGE